MKTHFKPLHLAVVSLLSHPALLALFSIIYPLSSIHASIVTAGLEFAEGTPQGSIIVQCIDTNSALLGQWTVPESGIVLTNAISATSTDTNAMIGAASMPFDSVALSIDETRIAASRADGNIVVAPCMRIGSVDAASGIAEIDLRLLRKALGAWQPMKYGAFTNEYAGFSWTVTCVAEPKARTEGRSFVTVNAEGLSRDDLDGATVCAFIDADGNGRWTAGELFGCSTLYATNPIPGVASTNSAMPWLYATNAYVKAWPDIALTRTSPSMARFDLSPLLSWSSDVTTDRDVYGYITPNIRTNASMNLAQLPEVRLRVVRTAVNGQRVPGAPAFGEVVLDRTFNASLKPLFTEADLVADGQLDLDWGGVWPVWRDVIGRGSASFANIESATYRVVIGNGTTSSGANDVNNLIPVEFTNAFEPLDDQTLTTPLTPQGTIDSGRPTFTWRHDNTIGKSYPAFQLKVWKADNTLVYDSGVRKAPPRSANGVYSWTAPLYANMVTAQGQIFATTNNYKWAVSMLDAKFTEFCPDENKVNFRLE